VYSLGVLAYRLLLGEPPFTAERDVDLLRKHLCGMPPVPRSRWRQIPAVLEATLLAMLAKQPSGRPTLADVAAALRAARDKIRPRRRWFAAHPVPTTDVIGRPMLAMPGGLSGRSQQAAGAALGVALVIASLLQLFNA
jgi:serine/threonine protein kinase